MPTTAINALRVPASSDSPNAPLQFTNLATDVDSRLVSRHASAAARDSAITAPVEGMVAYTQDDNRFWWHTGTGWQYLGGNPPAMIAFPGTTNWNVAGVGTYSLPKYYKDGSGIVRGQGVISYTGPSIASPTMGTLPSGYRPLNLTESVVLGVTGAAVSTYQAEIATSGIVKVIGTVGTNTNFFLNQLVFNPNN